MKIGLVSFVAVLSALVGMPQHAESRSFGQNALRYQSVAFLFPPPPSDGNAEGVAFLFPPPPSDNNRDEVA
jgi:hypothetical protein